MGKDYVDALTESAGLRRQLARVKALGSAPLFKHTSVGEFVRGISVDPPRDVPDGLMTLVGGVAGAYYVKDHRLLGLIGGVSVGRNVPALLDPELRRMAVCNVAQTGTAIAVSLSQKSTFRRVAGFVLGWLVAGGVIHFGGLRQ